MLALNNINKEDINKFLKDTLKIRSDFSFNETNNSIQAVSFLAITKSIFVELTETDANVEYVGFADDENLITNQNLKHLWLKFVFKKCVEKQEKIKVRKTYLDDVFEEINLSV